MRAPHRPHLMMGNEEQLHSDGGRATAHRQRGLRGNSPCLPLPECPDPLSMGLSGTSPPLLLSAPMPVPLVGRGGGIDVEPGSWGRGSSWRGSQGSYMMMMSALLGMCFMLCSHWFRSLGLQHH